MDDPSPPTWLPPAGLGGRPGEAGGYWLLPLWRVGSEAGQGGLQEFPGTRLLGSGHGSEARGPATPRAVRDVSLRRGSTCPLGPSLWGP